MKNKTENKRTVEKIKDPIQASSQFCVLTDNGLGLSVELYSTKLTPDKLSKLARENFEFLKTKRTKTNRCYIN